jgi:Trk K+ transport system NAD-binding subunit
MIEEIKAIVQNYLNNSKLCNLTIGTVVPEGIKISDKLTIPDELISGDLKNYIVTGNIVKLIRNHGGQEFYIVEIIGVNPVLKGMTLTIEPIVIPGDSSTTITSIKINEVSL